jgi:putative transcriptional regulator
MRQWLVKKRKEQQLSQQKVADLVGISRSYYSEIEVGVKTPSGKTAKKIADIFDVDMAIFFDDHGREMSHKPA